MIPIRRRLYELAGFTPRQIFAALQGAWYEAGLNGTLFTTHTGETAASAEFTVGLALDKSQGAVLGPELVTNGDFSDGTTGWAITDGGGINAAIESVGGELKVTCGSGGILVSAQVPTTIGKTYIIVGTGRRGTNTTNLEFGLGPTWQSTPRQIIFDSSTPTTKSGYYIATTAISYVLIRFPIVENGKTAYFDNISVREVLGNHATQSTAANRPILKNVGNTWFLRHDANDVLTASLPAINVRRNLLTYSEQFDHVAWGSGGASNVTFLRNIALSPFGEPTADGITYIYGSSYNYYNYNAGSAISEKTYTYSVWIATPNGKASITVRMTNAADGNDAAFLTKTLTTTLTRVSLTRTFTGSGNSIQVGFDNRSLADAGTVVVFGAQLELGSVATPYQKVTDWTSEAFSSAGSTYFATPVGMSAIHNQSIGQSYNLPALSTDIYGSIVVPERLSAAREAQLARYMERLAGIAGPDYLTSDVALMDQLTADDGTELLLAQ